MTQALDQSILELLDASRDDQELVRSDVNDRGFGFHAQQAFEKLVKALIAEHQVAYEFSHDLGRLIRHAQALGEGLPIVSMEMERFTEYAGAWRYQYPAPLTADERAQAAANVATLRSFVLARLCVLRPGHNWLAA